MFKSNKVNHMTVIVKGVRDDDYEGRELMMEVVRRNCKMDPRLVGQTVYRIRTYEDEKKKRSDFNVDFEAFDMGGIIRDFKLLQFKMEYTGLKYHRKSWKALTGTPTIP